MPFKDSRAKKAYMKEYYRKHKDKWDRYNERRKVDPELRKRALETRRRYKERVRREVLEHYGGNPPKCACCGETIREFLTIDHIKGKKTKNHPGFKQKRRVLGNAVSGRIHEIKVMARGVALYIWLRAHNYPPGYQVLCMNCNYAKGQYGHCPHEDLRRSQCA